MAEAAFDARIHGGPVSVIDVLEADRDNVRAALDWGLAWDPECALGLAGTLVEDLRRSLFDFREMRPYLQELLARTSPGTPRHAHGLIAAGYMALVTASDDEAMTLFGESVRRFQELGDACGEAWARLSLGHMLWVLGDLRRSSAELRLSERLHIELGNRLGRHRARLRAAMAEVPDPVLRPAAMLMLDEAIAEGEVLGDAFGTGLAHSWRGIMEVVAGAPERGRPHLLEGVSLLKGDPLVAAPLIGLAMCCVETDPERCLRLLAAADWLQPRSGLAKPRVLAEFSDECHASATAQLGRDAAERAYAAGDAMSREEAISLALSSGLAPEPGRSNSARPGGLTQREAEVAGLVSHGLTSRQIADSLCLSVRTVETHVDRVLTKLGFHSRARLASWVREQGL